MVSLDAFISGPGRVVVYGHGDGLAGDLAAGLGGKFRVEKVASLPEALHALVEPTLAMLIVAGEKPVDIHSAAYDPLLKRAAARQCKIVVVGDAASAPVDKVLYLKDMPGPWELAACLAGNLHPAKP